MIKLPVNFQPLITSRETEAFVFSILTAKNHLQLPFLLSRYISLFAYDSEDSGAALAFNNNYEDYYFWQCGKLSLMPLHIPNYAVYPGITVQLAREMLDDERYILGIWNEQYIKSRPAYNLKCKTANFMLYGYDGQGFYSLAPQADGLGGFTVTYEEFEKALFIKESGMNMFWGAALANAELGFEIAHVRKDLKDFVEGSRLNNDGCAFGYKSIEYVAVDMEKRGEPCSAMELKCIWEYTRLMRMRTEYMINLGKPLSAQEKRAGEIEKEALRLSEPSIISDCGYLIREVKKIAEQERILAEELLDVLEKEHTII